MEGETGRTTMHISPSSPTLADRDDTLSQRSTVECSDSVFGAVPTRAEANYSMTAFQSFMNHEGPRMLEENPGFRSVETAFHFLRTPMVQEMVGSVMCDTGVIGAILRNDAIQAFLKSLLLGNSTTRLTNSGTDAAAAASSQRQGSEKEDGLVSMVLSWLLDNIGSGFVGIYGTLRSMVSNGIESPQNGNKGSGSSSGQVIQLTLLLSIINLLIVFVRRALNYKLMI